MVLSQDFPVTFRDFCDHYEKQTPYKNLKYSKKPQRHPMYFTMLGHFWSKEGPALSVYDMKV